MTDIYPVIGAWYRRPGSGLFEVVAIDEDDRTIEVQFFDGTVAEIDLEAWMEMYLEEAEPPEDWTGPMDLDREDAEPGGNDIPHRDYASPLDFFDHV